MPSKKLSLMTTQVHQNQRLDHLLAEWLPIALRQSISKAKVRKLIVAGAVYLNGRRVRIASKNLVPNARIEVYVDLHKLYSTDKDQDLDFVMTKSAILYEDEYLIAINKPPGLPTQPTVDEARENLFLAVKKFLAAREKVDLPKIYLGLHHRLDRDTSGVILFTKRKEANPGIATEFSSHLAEKTYQALAISDPSFCDGNCVKSWSVKNFLGRCSTSQLQKNSKKARFGSVRSGGDFAQTDFKLLGSKLFENHKSIILIQAKPKTGRTHQIRVHLSEAGHPILGDAFYGGPTEFAGEKIPRIM